MTEQKNIKLIKKYKNRRLYDLERSQYITIEELQSYVMQDIDFRVLDAGTGKDLTSATLLQIFVDLESNAVHVLSPQMLCQLIKMSQHPLSHQYKDLLEKMLMSMQEKSQPFAQGLQQSTEFWTQQSEQLLKSWQELFKHRGE